MSSWKDEQARTDGTWNFSQMLDTDPNLRDACKKDRALARETLRKAGNFDDLPDNLDLYVSEDNIDSGDQVATLVLYGVDHLPPREKFVLGTVWRCSWSHYLQ
jgi:hypothetical protein